MKKMGYPPGPSCSKQRYLVIGEDVMYAKPIGLILLTKDSRLNPASNNSAKDLGLNRGT